MAEPTSSTRPTPKPAPKPAAGIAGIPAELLQNLQVAAPEDARKLIGGLPEDFKLGIAPSPSAVAPAKGVANYFTGDEAALFRGMRPAEIWRIQQKLVDAGYLTAEFRKGDFTDKETQNALTEMLTGANMSGMDWESHLEFARDSGMYFDPETGKFTRGKKKGGAGGGRLPTRLSDPTTLYETVQEVAANRLGRRLSHEEAQKFVGQFHGYEQRNDAGNLEAPNIELYADKFARASDPVAYDARDYVNVFQETMKLINSGGVVQSAPAPTGEGGTVMR